MPFVLPNMFSQAPEDRTELSVPYDLEEQQFVSELLRAPVVWAIRLQDQNPVLQVRKAAFQFLPDLQDCAIHARSFVVLLRVPACATR